MEAAIDFLPEGVRDDARVFSKIHMVTDVRIRAGKPVLLVAPGRQKELKFVPSEEQITNIVSRMLEHSLYAWEDQLSDGYFTLPCGARVGVAGRFSYSNGSVRIAGISSMCVRIAREIPGCAEGLISKIMTDTGILSTVILGGPGSGKTTLLRDCARLFSESGRQVAIVDERSEIAACRNGVATLDVGQRADIIEGLRKSDAILRLIRSLAPDVVVTDELGAEDDVYAVREAARMGVKVLATAHAASLSDALSRPVLSALMREGIFEKAIVIHKPLACISDFYAWRTEEGGIWRSD